jgi:Asp/Glu/hydantoin racemase
VVGLAESAVSEAAERALPFAIVTAGAAWIPMLTDLVRLTPHAQLFRGVIALDTTGLEVAREPERFVHDVNAALERAAAAGAETVILGGAAFAGSGARFAHKVALIDPMHSAVRAAERAVLRGCPRAAPARVPALAWRGLSRELTRLLAGECSATADESPPAHA